VKREEGTMTTELVLIVPVLLVLLGFVVMTGRIGQASTNVDHAAHQAARAASLVGTADSARLDAVQTATANLDDLGIGCRDLVVEVDTSRFEPGGHVGVSVTCTVDLKDLAFAGLPGQRTLRGEAVEVIDRFRGVGR
jgi:Flp pilus assembly protein TadG